MSRKPPPRIDEMISLKVDNLSYRTTLEDIRRAFERCGEVGDIYIPRDRHTRQSRGFAFVRFYDKRDAEDAIDAMDGRILDGRELRVQMARYGRPPSPQRRGGGRYDGRRYRSRSRDRRRDRRSRSRSGGSRERRRNYSRSKSKSRSRTNSKSPRGRDSRSRSPERRRSDSKSPRARDSRSRSADRRRSDSKSPRGRESRSRSAEHNSRSNSRD